jgi:hypothetical protein
VNPPDFVFAALLTVAGHHFKMMQSHGQADYIIFLLLPIRRREDWKKDHRQLFLEAHSKKEDNDEKNRDKKSAARPRKMAEERRGYSLSEEGVSGKGPGLGGEVHGIREGTREYGSSEGTPIEGRRNKNCEGRVMISNYNLFQNR